MVNREKAYLPVRPKSSELTVKALLVRSLSPRPEILSNADGVVLSPRTVGAEPCRTERLIARSEARDVRVLGEAEFEALRQVDANAPLVFHADAIP